MNETRIKWTLWLVWFWPAGWAYGGDLRYAMPVGPYPLLSAFSTSGIFHIPLAIAVMTLVLSLWAPRMGVRGNLSRAITLYMMARIGETTVLMVLALLGAAMEDSQPFVLLLVGMGIAVPVGLHLYRQTDLPKHLILMAACSATLASYLTSLAYLQLMVPEH